MIKGACQSDKVLNDIVAETALSSSGLAASLAAKTVLKGVGAATGGVLPIALNSSLHFSSRHGKAHCSTWRLQDMDCTRKHTYAEADSAYRATGLILFDVMHYSHIFLQLTSKKTIQISERAYNSVQSLISP